MREGRDHELAGPTITLFSSDCSLDSASQARVCSKNLTREQRGWSKILFAEGPTSLGSPATWPDRQGTDSPGLRRLAQPCDTRGIPSPIAPTPAPSPPAAVGSPTPTHVILTRISMRSSAHFLRAATRGAPALGLLCSLIIGSAADPQARSLHGDAAAQQLEAACCSVSLSREWTGQGCCWFMMNPLHRSLNDFHQPSCPV